MITTTAHDARFSGHRKATAWQTLALLGMSLCLLLASGVSFGAYRVTVIATDLRFPWSVAPLPQGGFLVSERVGNVLRLHADGTRETLSGLPPTHFAGQGGYLDLALHPQFEQQRLFYLSYVEAGAQGPRLAVFRARLSQDTATEGETILRETEPRPTALHFGGRLMFVGDGSLLLSTGDGLERREQAQSLDSELGKVLRVTGGRTLPAAALDDAPGASRIYSFGHRNPQGLTYDEATGRVFLHEHGPRGGDELNLLLAGHNYGWPAVSEGVDYSGALVTPFRTAPDMEPPLWTWTPSIAPSGLALYRGQDFPGWRDSLLVGSLSGGGIRRLQLRDGQVVEEEWLLDGLQERIRDLRVIGESVYVLTDGERGRLLQLQPSR